MSRRLPSPVPTPLLAALYEMPANAAAMDAETADIRRLAFEDRIRSQMLAHPANVPQPVPPVGPHFSHEDVARFARSSLRWTNGSPSRPKTRRAAYKPRTARKGKKWVPRAKYLAAKKRKASKTKRRRRR